MKNGIVNVKLVFRFSDCDRGEIVVLLVIRWSSFGAIMAIVIDVFFSNPQ